MENQNSLELIRAWAEGALDQEACAQFERALETDEELRQLADAYRTVYQMSAGDEAHLPQSSLRFEDVAQNLEAETQRETSESLSIPRAMAVAASLLVLGSIAWFGFMRPSTSAPQFVADASPLALKTIPLKSSAQSTEVDMPATLASYHPVSEDRIEWVEESEEATRIASATGRPLLIFGRYSQCGVADEAEESMAKDQDMRELAAQCVPMVVDLDELEDDEREDLLADGYPGMQVRSAKGDQSFCVTGEDQAGMEENCDLKERIKRGIGKCGMQGGVLEWQLSRDLAELYEFARKAEESGKLAKAHQCYEKLVAGGGDGLLAEAGERGLVRIALAARDCLLDARALCEGDAAGARRLLAEAVVKFEGTPHVAELALVQAAIRRTGVFPALTWATN